MEQAGCVRMLAWSRVAVLHTASSSRGCHFLTHNRLQVSLGVVERTKDPEEAQLPEGLKQNQRKYEERKNR